MTTQIKRRWGILSLAVIMFLVTLIVTNINGAKSSIYYFVWMMVGYYAYKDMLPDIKTLMKIVIIINIAAMGLIAIFMDGDNVNYLFKGGKSDLIFGVLVMLVPKIFLYLYCNKQLNESTENQTNQNAKGLNVTTQPATLSNTNKPIHVKKMEGAYQSTLQTRNISAIELNFTIANPNTLIPSINSDAIWEEIYKEFESGQRNLGLWARLFAQHEGNETKAKAEYLKIRFDLKLEELERAASNSQDAAKVFARKDYVEKTEETCIKDNIFDLYSSSGHEIYVFPNGNAAYKRFKIYKVYNSKEAAINAIKTYLLTEVVGRTGFIRDFREEDLLNSYNERNESVRVDPTATEDLFIEPIADPEKESFDKLRIEATKRITSKGHSVSMSGNYPTNRWEINYKSGKANRINNLTGLLQAANELNT
jgi:hypothetical protein